MRCWRRPSVYHSSGCQSTESVLLPSSFTREPGQLSYSTYIVRKFSLCHRDRYSLQVFSFCVKPPPELSLHAYKMRLWVTVAVKIINQTFSNKKVAFVSVNILKFWQSIIMKLNQDSISRYLLRFSTSRQIVTLTPLATREPFIEISTGSFKSVMCRIFICKLHIIHCQLLHYRPNL